MTRPLAGRQSAAISLMISEKSESVSMGGIGSGRRWRFNTRGTTSDYLSLDVRRLQREQLLLPGRSCGLRWKQGGEAIGHIGIRGETDRVVLDYRYRQVGSDWKPMQYAIRLDWTRCTFGGQRAWFRCPAQRCGRRVALLYLGGAGIFACRQCYAIVYASQRETYDDRAARRVERIRDRLGWEAGILNGDGGKPKGMHWRTFERLTTAHDALVEGSLAGCAARIGLLRDHDKFIRDSLDRLWR